MLSERRPNVVVRSTHVVEITNAILENRTGNRVTPSFPRISSYGLANNYLLHPKIRWPSAED